MKRSRIVTCLSAAAGVAAIHATAAQADAPPTTFKVYGFAQGDYIYDSQRMDPNWVDAFRPSKIATPEGEFGSPGQSSVSVKQSRFGVSGTRPTDTDWGPINFKFEFDLFGVGVDEGQTTIRFRHVYAEWGPLLAGQTNTLFMDVDIFPNVIDYWGPAGMVFLRNPQLRYTPYKTDNSWFSFAIERPGNDVDPGQIREVDPSLGANIESDEKFPDLSMQYQYHDDDWGHVQLAGILRRVGFDTLNAAGNFPKGAEVGWGIDATAVLKVFEKDKILLGVVHGDGIANYMNDGGTDLAAAGTLASPHAEAVPLTGISAYYDHYWIDQLSTSLGYSFTQVDNASLQEATAFHKGQYASINLLWTPTDKILIGGEVLWGQRTDNDGVTGRDVRFQFSVKYSWDVGFNI
jgi:hypothetical protein